jgi:hypothetical protein
VATLKLNTQFTSAPQAIVVHLPWFVDVHSASADGKAVVVKNGALTVAAGTRQIDLHWTVKPNSLHMSYENAVAAYKAEYARRYRELVHGVKTGNKGTRE